MRLKILENGHRLPARLFIAIAQGLFRHRIDPVIRVLTYRPEFFGRAMSDYIPEVLRGESYWTTTEREFFAVHTSMQNECPFCVTIHSAMTQSESSGTVAPGDVHGLRTEAIAILPLLEKTSRTPELLTRADIDAIRAAGVPDAAIIDALHVNAVFNLMNRIANALDFDWESPEQVDFASKVLHRVEYRIPGILLR